MCLLAFRALFFFFASLTRIQVLSRFSVQAPNNCSFFFFAHALCEAWAKEMVEEGETRAPPNVYKSAFVFVVVTVFFLLHCQLFPEVSVSHNCSG